jgi:hypothetical protein
MYIFLPVKIEEFPLILEGLNEFETAPVDSRDSSVNVVIRLLST